MIQKQDEIGPIHQWLPAAMKLKLSLVGDEIVSSETEFGYLCRSIEKKVIGKNFADGQRFLSRIEPESACIIDRVVCECIEKTFQIELTERAEWARDISCSLIEVSGILRYLTMMSKRMGLSILNHVILKHREELLDLTELLTGSRYGYYFIVAGGVRYDITAGFIERLENWIKALNADYPRIESMFLWTHFFQNRMNALGKVLDHGNMGFVSFSSEEGTRLGMVSSVESRLSYALKQLLKKTAKLNEEVNEVYTDEHIRSFDEVAITKGQPSKIGTATCETYRGTWSISLSLDQDGLINHLEVSTPSNQILPAIPHALEHESFDDIPLILQSLNFVVSEVDR